VGVKMVLPAEIATAAESGDLDAVRAWLDGKPDGGRACINEYDEYGCTLLISCVMHASHPLRRVALARLLLERGADVNRCAADVHNDHMGQASPLHCAAKTTAFLANSQMLPLLIAAGGNVKARTSSGGDGYIETPLGRLLRYLGYTSSTFQSGIVRPGLPGAVAALLRGGAELDEICVQAVSGASYMSAETLLQQARDFVNFIPGANPNIIAGANENFTEVRKMIEGVRGAGSWKAYIRRPHKDVCAVRGLVTRGFLAPPGGGSKYERAIAFVVGLGDNGIVWKVLSYWRADN
jgi:hypothetical protein